MSKRKGAEKWPRMDAEKWKSVVVDRKTYDELFVIKGVEGRTLSGQFRLIFDEWKSRNLSPKDQVFINDKVAEMRESERLNPTRKQGHPWPAEKVDPQ